MPYISALISAKILLQTPTQWEQDEQLLTNIPVDMVRLSGTTLPKLLKEYSQFAPQFQASKTPKAGVILDATSKPIGLFNLTLEGVKCVGVSGRIHQKAALTDNPMKSIKLFIEKPLADRFFINEHGGKTLPNGVKFRTVTYVFAEKRIPDPELQWEAVNMRPEWFWIGSVQ